MRISTIVPAYNRAELIGATLRSLLEQTRAPDELIVVDDGSTDGTPDVARDHGATVICQSNAGAGAARNAGLARSTGEIVHFMDSDDLASPNSYRIQARLIETGSDIVYGPWLRTRFDGHLLHPEPVVVQQRAVAGGRSLDKMVLTGRWLTVFQPCLFRRATLEAAGPYRTDLKTAEDIELLYRLTRRATKIAHAADTLVLYRVHPENQLSEQNAGRRAVDFARLWLAFQDNVDARDDLGWTDRVTIRMAKQKAAREAREHAGDLADALVSDCSFVDPFLFRARAFHDRVMAKLRFHSLGHRYKPEFAVGKLSELQREQIAAMGYTIADAGSGVAPMSQAG
jgi:glycosyltransferase involved in cell wall biosynthesis